MALVRAAVEALNRGDWDVMLADMPSEFEYDLTRTASPLRGVYAGDRIHWVVEEFLGTWDSVRYEAHALAEVGEHVVMPFTAHFAGRDGIELQAQATWVWTFRGDAAVRLSLFQNHDEALAFARGG